MAKLKLGWPDIDNDSRALDRALNSIIEEVVRRGTEWGGDAESLRAI